MGRNHSPCITDYDRSSRNEHAVKFIVCERLVYESFSKLINNNSLGNRALYIPNGKGGRHLNSYISKVSIEKKLPYLKTSFKIAVIYGSEFRSSSRGTQF